MTCPVIEFDAATHTYTVNGEEWPSVTTIIQDAGLCNMIGWNAASATKGTHVHEACRLWDAGELDEDVLDERLRPYLAGWKKFCEETGWITEEAEVVVGHEERRYAGTLDRIGLYPCDKFLVDIKTGAKQKWHGLQLAAYAKAHGQGYPVMAVRLTPAGNYIIDEYDVDECWPTFEAAARLWWWKKENMR